ncbi:FAD-dependent oxidoreductase [Candidatus Gottesmanbacteria bacterium]|nr:FAD-dependent oxidoreductase [Candidatus Gottesmanbacteria bacterium]
MKKSKRGKILILGGGLAGLAAGFELAKANKSVEVFEKWNEVGGLARTINVGGFRFDTGPHRWYTKSNMVNDWMLKLLGPEVIKVPRLTRIYFDGKFFYYPIKLLNALFGIGIARAFMAVFDYTRARLRARLFKRKLVTLEDGYINQFGQTLYKTFFQRYSEKLWGEKCIQISVDWVGQRTRGLNILTILKDIFFKSGTVVSLVDEFSYPKDGVGRIAEKLASEMKEYKGVIHTLADVTKIFHDGKKITAIGVKHKKGMKRYEADFVISSIPINDFCLALTPLIDERILQLAHKLRYRDELQVALFVKKTHITPDTWIYVHPKEIPFMRVMEMDNWSDGLSPKGTTSLVFEIACNEGDRLWRKSDKEIIKLVSRSYIEEFHLIDDRDIIRGYVHRVPKEYPVYHIGYRQDVKEIKLFLKRFKNLQLIGRNGTFRYNNMDHSIEMGLYAAWNIIKGRKLYDVESVNIEREYLEEKKIENVEDKKLENEKTS